MLTTVKNYSQKCNGKTRTITVIYTEKNIRNSQYYVFEKSNYTPCEDCSLSDCPVYQSAPRTIELIR